MNGDRVSLATLVGKTVVVHTTTYFLAGLLAFFTFDYSTALADPALAGFMRSTDDPLVRAGVLFQPLRGVLFALAFYPLRSVLFGQRNGWATLWLLLVSVGIFSTFGPSPGSVEGLIYTRVPFGRHSLGLIEVLLQSLALSVVLFHWVSGPRRRWLTVGLVILFALALLLPALGALASSVGTA